MKARIDRKGLTLVELLIVVGLITLLAATVLPSMRTLLEDQKANQAAIQLRGVFEAAKTKAVGRNRSVAVVLERMDDSQDDLDPNAKYIHQNTVLRVSLAEVLPPYRGDIENASAVLSADAAGWTNIATISFVSNPSLQIFAVRGAMIAFDDRSERFEILSTQRNGQNWEIVFANYPNNANFTSVAAGPYTFLPPGNHSFRIYSYPRRLFNRPSEFNKGMCIDLTVSGIGQAGAQFASDVVSPTGFLNSPSRTFKPVYIVFNPQGQVSEILCNAPDFQRIVPRSSIYFLLGRTDQLNNPRTNPTPEFLQNISDEKNSWLRIIPETGQITIAPNLDPIAANASNPLVYSRSLATGGSDQSGR